MTTINVEVRNDQGKGASRRLRAANNFRQSFTVVQKQLFLLLSTMTPPRTLN